MALNDEYRQESWKAGDFLKASQLNSISKTLDDTENAVIELQNQIAAIDVDSVKQDVTQLEERVNTSIADVNTKLDEKATVAALDEVNEALAEKQEKGDYPVYEKFVAGATNQERKTIQLKNFDSISGVMTNGVGVNLAMVSKWDVADFGSTQLHLNLNSKDAVTLNDDKVIATLDDIPSVDNFATKEELAAEATRADNSVVASKEAVKAELEASIADSAKSLEAKINEVKNEIPQVDPAAIEETTKEVEELTTSVIPTLATKVELQEVENKIPTDVVGAAALATAVASVEAKIPQVPDVSGFATKEEVNAVEARIPVDPVVYQEFTQNDETRKTIQLKNYDTISGVDTTGAGHNLVMLSKWNVADFGAPGVHMNLNTKDSVTINDDKKVATTDMIDLLAARLSIVEDLSYKANKVETIESVNPTEDVADKTIVLNKVDSTPVTGLTNNVGYFAVSDKDATMDVAKAPKELFVVNESVNSGAVNFGAKDNVNINVMKLTGELASGKNGSNAAVKVQCNGNVTIANVDYQQNGYNGVEVGLNSVPTNVTIKNIEFKNTMSNNAISVFDIVDGGSILIENCKFNKVSNVLRLSVGNRELADDQLAAATQKTITVTLRNCEVGEWDSGQYTGLICLQDMSGYQAQFGKMKIVLDNCTHNGVKIEGTVETLTTPGAENQVVYLYKKGAIISYSEHPDWFPTIETK